MEKIHVGALIRFTHFGKRKSFPQLKCCGEKYSKLKLVNIENNSDNFLVTYRFNIYTKILTINSLELLF
jgi:uncharacterized protein Veg